MCQAVELARNEATVINPTALEDIDNNNNNP